MDNQQNQPFASSPLIWIPERVFVSCSFGCPARCAFCYLPVVAVDKPADSPVSPEDLMEQILSNPRFKLGPSGTVLSLGCLAECLAPHAIKSTLRFLTALGHLKNPVQIATRWSPSLDELDELIYALQRLRSVVFHSMVEWGGRVLESGTPPASQRES